jgi:hypothetical protein
MDAFLPQWQGLSVVVGTAWPAKPKMFTIWTITEKSFTTPVLEGKSSVNAVKWHMKLKDD